jgi:hypothetical protein
VVELNVEVRRGINKWSENGSVEEDYIVFERGSRRSDC